MSATTDNRIANERPARHSLQGLVRGPSKREIKWLVKTLKLRNRHFFTGILPAEDVAMTCVLVWLGSRGMRLQARPSNDKVSGQSGREGASDSQ